MINIRSKKIKSMLAGLSELRPHVIDRRQILSGSPIRNFENIRPRELLGNWVLCAALNENAGLERFFIASDSTGSDGVIFDSLEDRPYFTEHVLALNLSASEKENGEENIVMAINKKRNKGGLAYGKGKILVVLAEGIGEWKPNIVRRLIEGDFVFDDIWVFGLCSANDQRYTYGISRIDRSDLNCPTWIIEIMSDFASFETTRIQ